MAKAKKMPSDRYRTLVYSHTEKVEDPSTGKLLDKHRYKSFVGDTAAESELMAAQFKFDRKKQKKTSSLTLGDAIEQYIDNSSNILSPTTVQSYRKIRKNAFSKHFL